MHFKKYCTSSFRLARLSLALGCMTTSIAHGEVFIKEFPYELDFDANDYDNALFVSTEDGATHEWRQDDGWRGGAAKFTPNTLRDNKYMGLGQFMFHDSPQERIHIRYLVKFGTAWNPGNGYVKMAIVNRPEPGVDNPDMQARERPILGLSPLGGGNPPYRTFCAAGGGGLRCHDRTYENPWPDGSDPFKVIPPSIGVDEWVSVELEASTVPGEPVKVYLYTQDGRVAYGEGNPYASYDLHYHGRPFRYIDVLGYNNGVAPNSDPNNYYMVDELRVDTHYIGPPEGFIDGSVPTPDPQLTENSFVVLNPSLASTAVVSLVDNNVITAGDLQLNLGLYQSGVFHSASGRVLTPGTVIKGTGPFDLSSGTDGTDMPAHESMLGTTFAMPHTRYTHNYYMISPNGDATADIAVDGIHHQVDLPRGDVKTFNAGATNGNISAVINSTLPILVSHRAQGNAVRGDASPMPPASNELWGIKTSHAYIAAVENDTHVSLYANNGTSHSTMTLQAGEKRYINVGLSSNVSHQGAGSAIHLVSDKPINAVQMADSDGTEQTAFYPRHLLRNRFGIPKDSQYVAIACPEPDTSITLYKPNANPVTVACSANGQYPGKAFFGRSDANVVSIAQGSYLESTKPIYVIHEVADSNDEHNLMGGSSYALPVYSNDMEGTSPLSNWLDARTQETGGGTITFRSDGQSQVAQFNCKAGSSNEMWLRHHFGSYPDINEPAVNELWLNFEYLVADKSIYNPNPGRASKIAYVNWSAPNNRTRTSQVVLSTVSYGGDHYFRLSREVFDAQGRWVPGGQWLGDYPSQPIPENKKLYLQLHIKNSTNGEANGQAQLYNNGELIIEQNDVALNDTSNHSPNHFVLTPQISNAPGSASDGYSQIDNLSLYDQDPGPFIGH